MRDTDTGAIVDAIAEANRAMSEIPEALHRQALDAGLSALDTDPAVWAWCQHQEPALCDYIGDALDAGEFLEACRIFRDLLLPALTDRLVDGDTARTATPAEMPPSSFRRIDVADAWPFSS